MIASVDHQHVRVGNQRIPVFGLDVSANNTARIDTVDTHGDYLFLEFDLGALEGLDINHGFLVVDAFKTAGDGQPVFDGVDTLATTGNGAIDTFTGQQKCAAHLVLLH